MIIWWSLVALSSWGLTFYNFQFIIIIIPLVRIIIFDMRLPELAGNGMCSNKQVRVKASIRSYISASHRYPTRKNHTMSYHTIPYVNHTYHTIPCINLSQILFQQKPYLSIPLRRFACHRYRSRQNSFTSILWIPSQSGVALAKIYHTFAIIIKCQNIP